MNNVEHKSIELTEAIASVHNHIETQSDVINAYRRLNSTEILYKNAPSFLEKTFSLNEYNENNIAVSFKEQSYTFKELDVVSNQIADLLTKQRIKKNHMVGVFVDRGIEFIAAVFGILKAGATYVPIDPDYPKERIQSIISQCQFDIVISESAFIETLITFDNNALDCVICMNENSSAVLSGSQSKLKILDSKEIEKANGAVRQFAHEPDDIAYVIFTSGSTGVPKGVKVSHQNINNLVLITTPFELGSHSKVLQFAPLCFDISVGEIFPVLSVGGQVHILPAEQRKTPQMFIDTIAKLGITFITTTPSYFYQIIELAADNKHKLSSIQTVVLGGEPMHFHQIKRWRDIFGHSNKLYNVYGPTETTVLSSYYLVDDQVDTSKEVVLLGQPISNTQVYIVDQDDKLCSLGEVGELLIGGDGVTIGYLNDHEKTARSYPMFGDQRFYRSGDMGRLLAEGYLEFVARKDTQVKIRGFRVELGEIETALNKLASVKQAVVIDHERNGIKQLAAYIVTEKNQSFNRNELFEQLASVLPDYMIPASFSQLTEIPLTLNSKLDRRALPEPEYMSEEIYVAPRNELELGLCHVWQQVLGIEKIGVYDNFFRIGGNSIAAVRLSAESRARLQLDIPLALLFEHKTIAQLVAHLDPFEAVEIPKFHSGPQTLSYAQERLLFIEQFEEGTDAYHIPLFVKLSQQCNLSLLESALSQVIQRHEILNTKYRIDQQGNISLEKSGDLIVITQQSAADLQSCLSLVTDAIQQPFDLAHEASVKLTHYRVREDEYLLMLFHHIAFDGWSTDIFLRELSEVYDSLCRNIPFSLPELAIDYFDYAQWQKDYLQGARLEQLTHYWQEKLAGFRTLELPLDHPRPLHFDYKGRNVNFALDKTLSKQLRELARQQETTLYTVLLSAFYVTLYSFTEQHDIVVGTASDNRQHPQTQSLIGFFVNSLVLRMQIDRRLTIDDFIRQTHSLVSEALLHQELPFENLMNIHQIERDASRHPIFQVMFLVQSFGNELATYEKLPFASVNNNGEQSEYSLHDIYSPAKFDLTVILSDADEQINGAINFAASLFEIDSIRTLEQTYQQVLKAFVSDVSLPLEAVDSLTPEARAKTNECFQILNDTVKEYDARQTVVSKIDKVTEFYPENIAVAYKNDAYTYRTLTERANQLSQLLTAHLTSPNQMVGVFLARGVEFIPTILGVMKSGAAYVPIDHSHPAERVNLIISQCQLEVLITERELLASLSGINLASLKVIVFVDELNQIENEQVLSFYAQHTSSSCLAIKDRCDILNQSNQLTGYQHNPDDMAYVIFTSGSTGTPKGVKVSHRNLHNMTLICDQFGWDATYSVLQFAPLCFDVSVGEIFPILTVGGQIRILPAESRQSPQLYIDTVAKYQINIISMTPSYFYQLNDIAELNRDKLRSVKTVVLGGEAVLQSQANKWINVFGASNRLINAYGPTETTVLASAHLIEPVIDNKHEMVVMGKPINNTQIYIIDEQQRLCPLGHIGEIIIAGDGVTLGYLKDDEKTARVFIHNQNPHIPVERYYRTGDLGRLLTDGNIEFIGRKDNQVKIRGFRVELGEIESALNNQVGVKQCAVICHHKDGSPTITAYLVKVPDATMNISELRDALAKKLPHYMVPSSFNLIDEIPLTINGKLDVKALPAPTFVAHQTYTPPQSDLENLLTDIWADILQISREHIGIHDDFFHLGGHSLLAVKLATQIGHQLHRKVAVKDVFVKSTIAELSRHLDLLPILDDFANFHPIKSMVDDKGSWPLSFGQERLWFTDQLQQGSAEYNMSATFTIEGRFDLEVAQTAITKIIERHSVLRTTYLPNEEGALQCIQPVSNFTFSIEDISSLTLIEQQQRIALLIKQERLATFDLTKDLMVRGLYINKHPSQNQTQADQTGNLLLLSMHHISSDGWSMALFMKEFKQLYHSILTQVMQQLEPLALQYADYALWQRDSYIGQVREDALNYWLAQLSGAPTTHSLPLDFSRAKAKSHRGGRVTGLVDARIKQRLEHVANEHQMSLFMLLHAGLSIVLSRHSHSQDIVVGTPVANRLQSEISSLIGYFVNTIALRANTAFATLADYLKHIRAVHIDAQNHQAFPFEQLLEHLKIPRDLAHSPLFQILFSMEIEQISSIDIEGGTLARVADSEFVAKFDLDISCVLTEQGIEFNWVYDASLFTQAHIQTLSDHLCRFLTNVAQLAGSFDVHLRDLEMFAPSERQFLLHQLNDNTADLPQSSLFHEYFEAAAARHPNRAAIILEDERANHQLSYRELNAAANKLARYLRACGVTADMPVGLHFERSVDMIIAMLAVLKAGGAYAPLDLDLPRSRLAFICNDLALKVVLTQQALADKFRDQTDLTVVLLDSTEHREHMENVQGADLPLVEGQHRANAAYVIYTSGSTGTPKGVVVEHKNLCHYVLGLQKTFSIPDELHYGVMTSIATDLGNTTLLCGLAFSGTLHLFTKPQITDGHYLLDYMNRHPLGMLKLTPSHFNALFSDEQLNRFTCQWLFLGGEAIDRSTRAKLAQLLTRGINIFNHYGPTETTIGCCATRLTTELLQNRIPVGKPLPNVYSYLLAPDGHLAPFGAVGELLIGGHGVARGYFNQPEQTMTRFMTNPYLTSENERVYRTGDLMRYLPDGSLVFEGRIDSQVKVRGYRVELNEIENALLSFAGVEAAVVIAKEVDAEMTLIAYLVSQQDKALLVARCQHELTVLLPAYMVPSAYMVLDALPLMPNGKVDKKALPVPSLQARSEYVEPANDIEHALVRIWAKLFKKDAATISTRANFFELGGHSLLSIRLMSEIKKQFQHSFTIQDIFELQTLAKLAEQIEAKATSVVGSEVSTHAIVPMKRNIGESVLTSYAQQRLWFMHQLNSGSAEYNMPAAFRIEGDFDIAVAEKAISLIIARHESLRTVYNAVASDTNQALQQVKSEFVFKINELDLTHLPHHEQQTKVLQLVEQDSFRTFDISHDLMIRVSYYRLSEAHQRHQDVLMFNMHHIASDGWSMGIFLQEFIANYSQLRAGKNIEIAPLDIQYADYAFWQRQPYFADMVRDQLHYWKNKLRGAPALHSLALDYPRPEIKSYRGANISFQLTQQETDQLKQFASEHHMTLFMLLHASLSLLLSKHSASQDIVIGTAVANRRQVELESLIGFFVNTLVLRVNTDFDSVEQFLAHVRTVNLEAQAHQDIPFEQLVEHCQVIRSTSHSPLFQIMFSMNNNEQTQLSIPGVTFNQLTGQDTVVKFDIDISAQESSHGLEISWRYDTSLFSGHHIDRLGQHLVRLLSVLTTSKTQKMSEVNFLSDEEIAIFNQNFNNTNRPFPHELSLHQLFEAQTVRAPTSTAVIAERDLDLPNSSHQVSELSYEQLNEEANKLAHYLRHQGVTANSLVGICLERSIEMVVAILGILKAGGAYVPLDPHYPKARLDFILQSSGMKHLLCQNAIDLDTSSVADLKVTAIDGAEYLATKTRLPVINPERLPQQNPDNLAYVIFTSGSTGQPKGVMMQHRGVVNRIDWMQNTYQLTSSDNVLQKTPYFFDVSVWEFLWTLGYGAALTIAKPDGHKDAHYLNALIERRKVTVMHFVPSMLKAYLAIPSNTFGSTVRYVFCSGEALDMNEVRSMRARAAHVQLHNLYGPTEAAIDVSYYPCNDLTDECSVPIGKPIQNIELLVLDKHLNYCPMGVPGELCIAGVGLAKGYLNAPELTDRAFVKHPFSMDPDAKMYRTGDLVYWLPDGNLAYISRLDHQVKLRGLRIELGEIEFALHQATSIKEAVVVAKESSLGEQYLAAYVVLKDAEPAEAQAEIIVALKQQLKLSLPEYMVPSAFVFLEAIPLTPTGKIARKELPEPELFSATRQFQAPRNEIELKLCHIWQHILGAEQIGVHDNFFELGGHSLLANSLVMEINSTFEVSLELMAIFKAQTIADIAVKLEALLLLKTLALPQTEIDVEDELELMI